MDPEENEEQGDQKQKEHQGSGLDSRAIDFINKARGSQETQGAKTGGRLAGQAGKKVAAQGGRMAASAAASAAQGGIAAAGGGAAGGAAGAAGAGAAATSPAWGTAAAIILLLLLIVVLFIIVFSGGFKQSSGGATGGTGSYECTGTCQAGACSGTDIPDTNAFCSANPTDTCCVTLPPPGIQPPIRFYCQYDNWNTVSCKIDSFGCAPTSLAMVMSSYGQTYTPTKVATSVWDPTNNIYIGCASPGTSYDGAIAAKNWAKTQGFTVGPGLVGNGSTSIPNLNLFKQYLSSGYFIFTGAVMPFKCSSHTICNKIAGHAVVIYDVNPSTNTLYVYDPTYCVGGGSNSPVPRQMWAGSFEKWYWAIPIKR